MSDSEETGALRDNAAAARRADAAVAAIFLLLGVYVTYVSLTDLQAFSAGQVGPGVLPFLVGLTLILTSALVLWKTSAGVTLENLDAIPTLREGMRAGGLFVLMVVCSFLIPILGTLVALALFVIVELYVLERRSLTLTLGTTVAIVLLIYVFFEALLGVPLPHGTIGLL